MKKVWCFDIDGTLADIGHRLHYIQGEKKDWDTFFSSVSEDAPICETLLMAQSIEFNRDRIVFLSGRRESCRADTIEWLMEFGLNPEYLYMRKNGDFRPDTEVKAEMLEQMANDGFEPFAVVEDRKCMVDMWRSKGIFVFDVNQSGKDY